MKVNGSKLQDEIRHVLAKISEAKAQAVELRGGMDRIREDAAECGERLRAAEAAVDARLFEVASRSDQPPPVLDEERAVEELKRTLRFHQARIRVMEPQVEVAQQRVAELSDELFGLLGQYADEQLAGQVDVFRRAAAELCGAYARMMALSGQFHPRWMGRMTWRPPFLCEPSGNDVLSPQGNMWDEVAASYLSELKAFRAEIEAVTPWDEKGLERR